MIQHHQGLAAAQMSDVDLETEDNEAAVSSRALVTAIKIQFVAGADEEWSRRSLKPNDRVVGTFSSMLS